MGGKATSPGRGQRFRPASKVSKNLRDSINTRGSNEEEKDHIPGGELGRHGHRSRAVTGVSEMGGPPGSREGLAPRELTRKRKMGGRPKN